MEPTRTRLSALLNVNLAGRGPAGLRRGGAVLLLVAATALGACTREAPAARADSDQAPSTRAPSGAPKAETATQPAASSTTQAAGTAPTGATAPTANPTMNANTPQRDSNGVIINAKLIPDSEWQKRLSPEQYNVTRQKGTERAFTGKYWNTTEKGVYRCSNCGEILFTSKEKFESGCGWPSFYDAADKAHIIERRDDSLGMSRTEVICANCGAHLGHVFDDGPADKTGLRYCINSASIEMDKDAKVEKKAESKPETKPAK